MRIISGSARGRKLAEFAGSGIRPTPDRVREALFSILSSRLGSFQGLKTLEFFAGSGAMSLEALSRGTSSALLVDSSRQAARLIEENIERCKMAGRAELLRMTADAALPLVARRGPFDLILMDPPYNRDHVPRMLEKIATLQLLAQHGIICAETAAGEVLTPPEGLELLDARRYGSSAVHLLGNVYRRTESEVP